MFTPGNQLGKKSSRKGVSNKATKELRNKVQLIIEDNIDQIQKDLDNVEPKERLSFLIQLLNFSLPKLKSVEVTDDKNIISTPIIHVNLNEDEATI